MKIWGGLTFVPLPRSITLFLCWVPIRTQNLKREEKKKNQLGDLLANIYGEKRVLSTSPTNRYFASIFGIRKGKII